MKLENGTIINQYKIISAIGRGGMGEVFLAEDTKLKRQVALKILPSEFAEDKDRMSRFVREAQSASALNHPNIITIHEIGESDGTHFIATEFIDGKTLNDYTKANPLDYKTALEIGIQVASALDEAHSAGIVHRDIKPDNVMIRANGLVKILDFGIAKVSDSSTSAGNSSEDATAIKSPTMPGMIIGTANYMSPEQAKGKVVDKRTDIFSFGVVLYEMIAGQLPFEGENALEMIGAILKDEPKPLISDIPAEIAKIINKSLRKDRDERYQTIKDVGNDLKDVKRDLEFQDNLERSIVPNQDDNKTQILKAATFDDSSQTATNQTAASNPKTKYLAAGLLILVLAVGGFFSYKYLSPTKQIESIAVMPFVNEGGNAETEYLSDGMTETLINSLSQIPNLGVKARSSVFRYKGKETNSQMIGKELNVQAILNGRVIQRGDQLTLSLELIDAQTENVIWSENYNRKQADLVSLQSEIARDVSGKLKAKLSGADAAKVEKTYTTNAEAYQLYLKGRYFGRQYTLDAFYKAVESYNKALALDPNYALAYAGLSEAYFNASTIRLPPLEALPKAEEMARKALELDDSLAFAHQVMGNLKQNYDFDYAGSKREFERAIELDPNDATTYYYYGSHLMELGEFERGISLLERAHQMDPLNGEISAWLGMAYSEAGQNDKAIEHLQATLKIDDRNWWAYYWLGVAYNEKGMFDRSIEALNTAAKLDNSPVILGALAHTLARSGNKAEAQRVIDKLLEESKTRFVTQTSLVIAYAGLGDKEKAFEWLGKSYEAHDEGILYLKSHPMLAPLRDDPRYKAMLKRINLPE